jgi:hypothetical protein
MVASADPVRQGPHQALATAAAAGEIRGQHHFAASRLALAAGAAEELAVDARRRIQLAQDHVQAAARPGLPVQGMSCRARPCWWPPSPAPAGRPARSEALLPVLAGIQHTVRQAAGGSTCGQRLGLAPRSRCRPAPPAFGGHRLHAVGTACHRPALSGNSCVGSVRTRAACAAAPAPSQPVHLPQFPPRPRRVPLMPASRR